MFSIESWAKYVLSFVAPFWLITYVLCISTYLFLTTIGKKFKESWVIMIALIVPIPAIILLFSIISSVMNVLVAILLVCTMINAATLYLGRRIKRIGWRVSFFVGVGLILFALGKIAFS